MMIPMSRPSPSTIGTPEILNRRISASASRTGRSGPSVIGLRIIPLSLRFTRSTSAACRSIVMFLWITPMPPARAMAMAMSASVTVSMAAEISGMLSGMERVSRLRVETSRGWTVECRGTRRTSSKVSPTVWRIRLMLERVTDARRPTGAPAGRLAGRRFWVPSRKLRAGLGEIKAERAAMCSPSRAR